MSSMLKVAIFIPSLCHSQTADASEVARVSCRPATVDEHRVGGHVGIVRVGQEQRRVDDLIDEAGAAEWHMAHQLFCEFALDWTGSDGVDNSSASTPFERKRF